MINMPISKAAEILQTTYQGNDVCFFGCSTDTRMIRKDELFIALHGHNFNGHDYVSEARIFGACAALVEQNHDQLMPSIIVENTRQAMGVLAKGWRSDFCMPLIAITGSNGKTTVKEMVAAILSCQGSVLMTEGNFNNNIGVPKTLFCLGSEHQYVVIEMGANHPGEIQWLSEIAQPSIAMITQCALSHLEGFGSVEGIAHAKGEIFSGLSAQGVAVINGDDDFCDLWLSKSKYAQHITFGLQPSNDVTAQSIKLQAGKSTFQLVTPSGNMDVRINLPGMHNIMNVLAAASCAVSLDIPLATIRRGIESVNAMRGRLQIKSGIKNCRIIDDTYNANPASLQAALNVLSKFTGRHWLVLGDMGELGEEAKSLHIHAGEMSRRSGVERLYALGELTKFTVQAFGAGANHINSHKELAVLLITEVAADVTVLIKGSRTMGMEYLIDYLGAE